MIKIHPDRFEIVCNPIGRARLPNRTRTDLNIRMDLGHDILFRKYTEAPMTVLAVRDRVLANTPLGVAYTEAGGRKNRHTWDNSSDTTLNRVGAGQ